MKIQVSIKGYYSFATGKTYATRRGMKVAEHHYKKKQAKKAVTETVRALQRLAE